MPNTHTKLYRLSRNVPRLPEDLLGQVELLDDSPFRAVEVVSSTGSVIDVEATWEEERVLTNVISNGFTEDIRVRVRRQGWVRIDLEQRRVLTSSLGRLLRSLFAELWKPNALPAVALVSLDLRQAIAQKCFPAGANFEGVRVLDLPVDEVPALTAEIAACTRQALLRLVEGTPAVVDRLTIQCPDGTKATVSRNGSIKVVACDCEWGHVATIAMGLLREIDLNGEQ